MINESMKQEKELVMKEYQLLKDKNEYLKAQIARAIKGEKEDVASSPIKAVASSSEKQQPVLVYSGPTITPLVWSSIIQPLNPIHTHDPMVTACKLEPSDEQGFALGANGMRPPFYLMPCPWFFPLGNGLYPHPLDSFGVVDKQDDSSLGNPGGQVSALKVREDHVENHHSRHVRTDTSSPNNGAKSPNNLPDTSIRLAPSEENHLFGSHPNGLNSTPTSCKSVELTMAIKCEDRFQQDSIAREESGSSTSSHTTMQGHAVYHGKKLVDAAVAAEARKRRKELTRLKNHNGRQLRLHC
ncbi:Basic-leucine zipper domain [Thalictrum thalictroides]|uniref:Basic-leucine zipper domain n=1 Tax=Thalictrum thalictroides TaxID=46969 RepID=A0A7J6VUL3_THATH|nr:Basic-leucine zipper domain [Thalictrum thalictroides]